jgi:hypothetical protein
MNNSEERVVRPHPARSPEGRCAPWQLLTCGRRTALPRHQTLRATLDWSYKLLSEVERVVLRRFGV